MIGAMMLEFGNHLLYDTGLNSGQPNRQWGRRSGVTKNYFATRISG
jgi:hypothetical protein